MRAGASVRQCAILMPFDLIEPIEHSIVRLKVDSIFLEVWLDIDVGVVSLDAEGVFHALLLNRLSATSRFRCFAGTS
jgi:hypothetical protein